MIKITKTAAICNMGDNLEEIFQNIVAGKLCDFKIKSCLPTVDDLRCNNMLVHCVTQMQQEVNDLIQKYGKKRIGIVIATTNTGIDNFEDTGNYEYLKMSNPAEFLKDYLDLDGFYCGISTACSSGIKVFSTARRLMEHGICDAVIAGGTDEETSY